MPNGEIWKNIVTEEKSKPAETLAEFRGNYKYNLLDKNVRAFNAEVPMFAQWDDHEVTNNWWPGEPLTRAEHQRKKYVEQRVAAGGARAAARSTNTCRCASRRPKPDASIARFPMGRCSTCSCSTCAAIADRTAKAWRTSYGPAAYFLGPAQIAWLKRELMNSRATWKVIAADMPIGLIVVYDGDRKWGVEAIAQGDGPPRGRELEIADILDVHQARRHPQHRLAHRRRALHRRALLRSEQGGVPGFRAVLGIRLRPDPRRQLRRRTSSTTRSARNSGTSRRQARAGQNLPPSDGLQFFGHVAIDGASEVMTVTLKDWEDHALWSTTLEPKLG